MTFQVVFTSGTVKKILAEDWSKTIGAGAAWESPDSSYISTSDYLDTVKHEILLLKDAQQLSIILATDSNEKDKGIYIPVGFETISVTAKSGIVERLKYDKQNFDSKINTVNGDTNSVNIVVNDTLLAGDLIALGESSSLTIHFSLSNAYIYSKSGFDIIALSNEISML